MLTYHYTARNPQTGEKISADVQAANEQAAAAVINKEGLIPISIQLSSAGLSGFSSRIRHVSSKEKVLFARQLSTLVNAGLPLVQSLRNVGKQTHSKQFRQAIEEIITDVEAGSSLAAAMERHPDIFNSVFTSLIAAGEASGTLDVALDRLAIQQEKDADLMSKVKGAMVYPVIVMLVMVGVLTFMLVKVLPQVKQLYAGIPGATLPLITKILLGLSDFVVHRWWVVLILVVLIAFGMSRWLRSSGGTSFGDKFKMKAWPFGKLFMKMYMARFSRTGSTLVGSGVPLIQMLEIAATAVNNVHIGNSIRMAIEKVKGGKSLAESLENDPNFLELVPSMLKIGEESGAMEQMLGKCADYYEKEVDQELKSISTIIEPLLMVVLGVVAFIIVAAVLLPVYGLASNSGALGT